MTRLRLLPQSEALLAELDDPAAFLRAHGADVAPHAGEARAVVRQLLDFHARVGASPAWRGWLAVDDAARAVVGTCAFKGDPTPAGTVEIAYFTFPGHAGRGLATALALELVARARHDRRVRAVLAHTLPERNASCRVLEKAGFRLEGEVDDPEDGRVWRWRRDLRA